MSRLYLVRHAPTHAPNHAKTMVGWTDLPADLSDQAALARLNSYLPAAPVVSSDLRRAIATANALCHSRPRLPHDPALREIHFGAWELRSFAQVEAEEPALIRSFWDEPGTISAPGGESWSDICQRVRFALDSYRDGGDLIIVAHFGAIIAALQHALALDPNQALAHKIDTLSVTELTWDGSVWAVQRINHCP